MTILDNIIEHKKKELVLAKQDIAISSLMQREEMNRATLSLKKTLTDSLKTGIIAEFKRKSPSKGIINDQASVEEVTKAYTQNGASCLSILTDRHFFGGSLEDIEAARFNQIPILRKDFIIDEYQILEARAYGADVILLIAACLSANRVKELASYAKKLSLEVLLEIHEENELSHVCEQVDFVGVNNRNLKTFEVDLNNSIRLLHQLPKDKLVIAESGIDQVDTIIKLRKAGFQGFLIGENFMRNMNPGAAFATYAEKLNALKQ